MYLDVVIDFIGYSAEESNFIIIMSLVLLSVFALKAISALYINRVIISFSWNLQAQIRSALMSAYFGMPYTEYLRRNSSEYIVAIQSFTSQFTNGVVQSFLRILSEGIAGLVILVILAINNGPALMLLLILLGATSLGYDRIFRYRAKEYGKQASMNAKQMVQGINEAVGGLKEIRIFNKESHFHDVVKDHANQYSQNNIKSQFIVTSPRFFLELVMVTFIVLLVIGTVLSGLEVHALVPTLSLFGVASMRLAPSANLLISGISQMRVGRHPTSRLYEDLSSLQNTILHRDKTESISRQEAFHTLSLNKVCYRYPDAGRNAINNVTLEVKEGESIGLIGASGSGKTTLVDTMLGLLEPQDGSIFFNSKPLIQTLAEWRGNVAYLPQNVLLLDNTLKCNVALGIPVREIDDQKLYDALQQARLKELVGQLPEGVETMLGERGIRLSGGQRQRVALARAFYHDRNVLVMDEATSALDNETEQEIVEEIKQLKGRKTLIVIAHRLTTVQHCDRIYRLHDGEVVDQGTYESVVARHLDTVS